MEIIILIVTFVFGVLNIILFFKIWGMTNDVRRIANKLCSQEEKGQSKVISSNTEEQLCDIRVGDTVKVMGTQNKCEVIKIEDGFIWVNLNNKTVKYYPNEVEKV